MQNKEQHYDPRFYFIHLQSLILENKPKANTYLTFRLGSKISESLFLDTQVKITQNGDFFEVDESLITKEVHILKYGGEQFLNIFLKDGETNIGFCRLLLPPIFQLPHVKHKINAVLYNNVIFKENGNDEVCPSAQVTFDIYFQFNFEGTLEIIPISAHLDRNIAQIGQMRPRVKLQFEGQSWCSLQAQGGIHPHWTGHFNANKNSQGIIEYIQDNLKSNKLQEWSRLLRMAASNFGISSPQVERQEGMVFKNNKGETVSYFDCTEFKMRSAGSYLKIQILSNSFLSSTPEIIGSAVVRVGDAGFLKFPRRQSSKYFEEKVINLVHHSEEGEVPAGVLKIYVRFIFDISKIGMEQVAKYDMD